MKQFNGFSVANTVSSKTLEEYERFIGSVTNPRIPSLAEVIRVGARAFIKKVVPSA